MQRDCNSQLSNFGDFSFSWRDMGVVASARRAAALALARLALLCRLVWLVATAPGPAVLEAQELPLKRLRAALLAALSGRNASAQPPAREDGVLVVDVGGTRTKFLLVNSRECVRLPPAPTASIWQNPTLAGPDKFEPSSAPLRMRDYLAERGVDVRYVRRYAFSVPGTTDLSASAAETGGYRSGDYLSGGEKSGGERYFSDNDGTNLGAVVKNTPSMSPKFRGFDFKEAFREVSPSATVSAVADNLAAALGVACQNPGLR